jgi:hypothetical protein
VRGLVNGDMLPSSTGLGTEHAFLCARGARARAGARRRLAAPAANRRPQPALWGLSTAGADGIRPECRVHAKGGAPDCLSGESTNCTIDAGRGKDGSSSAASGAWLRGFREALGTADGSLAMCLCLLPSLE